MNKRFATPFETYHSSGSQFELPDGATVTVTDVIAETKLIGDKTFAGLTINATDELGEERSEFVWAGMTDRCTVEPPCHIASARGSEEQFKISDSSPLGIVLNALNSLEFPWNGDSWDEEGFTQLIGYRLTVERHPVLSKDGKPKTKLSPTTGIEYPLTNLSFSAWKAPEKGGNKGARNVNTPPSAAKKPAEDAKNAIAEELENCIISMIGDSETGSITRTAVQGKVTKWFTEQADRVAAIRLLTGSWFTDANRPFAVENGKITLK